MAIGGLPVTIVSSNGLPVTIVDGLVASAILPSVATATLQAEIDRVETAGGGVVYLSAGEGTHTALTLPNTVHLVGAGMGRTILNVDASVTGEFLTVDSTASDWSVQNMTIDYQSNANGQSIIRGNNVRGGLIKGVRLEGAKDRAALRFYFSATHASNGNLKIIGNELINGDSAGLLLMDNSASHAVYNVEVRNNYIYGGGSMCAIICGASPSNLLYDVYIRTLVCDNIFIGNGTGTYGSIPTEMWGHTDAIVRGNRVTSGTRGLGTSSPRNVEICDNVIEGQTIYAFETAAPRGLYVHGNTIRNCKTFLSDNLGSGTTDGLVIRNNQWTGTGLASADTGADGIKVGVSTGTTRNVVIEDNTFTDIEYLRSVVRVDGSKTVTTDVRINSNKFRMNSVYCTWKAIHVRYGNAIEIGHNNIRFSADFDGSLNPVGNNGDQMLGFPLGDSVDLVNVHDNIVEFTGAISNASNGVSAIGNQNAFGSPGAATRVSCNDNTIIGTFTAPIRLDINSGDTYMLRNNLDRAGGTNSINAAVLADRRTSIPTAGTYPRFFFVHNETPAIATGKVVLGWTRLTSGTGHVANTDWAALYATNS